MKKKTKYRNKKKEQGINRHHLINKTRGGTNVEENIRKTKIRLHNCLHELFGNGTPAEVLTNLMEYFDDVFTEGFRADILNVLKSHKGVEHNPRCFKGGRVKDNGIKPLLHKEQ